MDSEVATSNVSIAEVKAELGGTESSQPIKLEAYDGQEEEKENEELPPVQSSGESDALPGHEEIIDGFSFLAFDLESDLKVNLISYLRFVFCSDLIWLILK